MLVPVVVGLLTARGIGAGAGFGFWLLAVAEQINYFYVQLMHDTTADVRRLRQHGFRGSHLARDLADVPGQSRRRGRMVEDGLSDAFRE